MKNVFANVAFPTNIVGMPHEVGTLTLYHHQVYNSPSWLPSQSLTAMRLHALHNSAAIESDMQGALTGFVVDSHYMLGDLICLQTVDCALAALELMRDHGVTLVADGYTNINKKNEQRRSEIPAPAGCRASVHDVLLRR